MPRSLYLLVIRTPIQGTEYGPYRVAARTPRPANGGSQCSMRKFSTPTHRTDFSDSSTDFTDLLSSSVILF